MKCLLEYRWVKLPRNALPAGKGVMGYWAKLASRAAFRAGHAKYCGHINTVSAGNWAGGMVGLKSILGVKGREKALQIMDNLCALGYITYSLDAKTKKLSYSISDWVVKCSGAPCSSGAVYSTQGYGFLCTPRNLTQRLVERGYTFDDADAQLDLWCHTVWQDPHNAFSFAAPCVQCGQGGIALTLETLGTRWGWEKTKVWRFFQKHKDAFALHKLPGSYGCLVFNLLYPVGNENISHYQECVLRILSDLSKLGTLSHYGSTDNECFNSLIVQYSNSLPQEHDTGKAFSFAEDRVAVSGPYINTYFSDCWNCVNAYLCLQDGSIQRIANNQIRGPCSRHGPRFHQTEASA